MVAGVPYAGNSLWVGGFKAQELNSFGMDLRLTQSEQQAMGRMMTPAERASLGDMCQQINCDAVHIFDGHDGSAGNQRRETWVSLSGGTSITIGNNIYVADRHLSADGYISGPTLAHELTHVGQYQQWGGFGYAADGLLIQSVNTVANWLGADDPVYQVPLPTSKRFGQLNMEQQATVVEGCYRGISAYCSIPGQPYRF
jgi:hypothetical protein